MATAFLPVLAGMSEDIAHVATPVEASGMASYAWLMIAIPLVSSLVLLLMGRVSNAWGHWLGVAASWSAFFVGATIVAQLLNTAPESRRMALPLFTWIPAGEFTVDFGLMVDPLSMTFVMLVTFVGSLIHIYAVSYMSHDAARRRFFAYLNLFIAAMLTLVLGDSYAALFVGWEGVGLASYLLIGFWNFVPDYAKAAKKAFVMNRVGDMGLLLAMMVMVANVSTVNMHAVAEAAPTLDPVQATLMGLFLLVGACGKSAQFPLQAWLGDAMAGPTPVSALIHAATMVTAGVYLVVRSGAVYQAAPIAAAVVVIIGAITLLFGAIVGAAKDDMKKVLAASTMSQIGYMMLGAGLGPIGWAFAIFHLFTHGFFKALMFLGAGSVMHAMNDQVNMRRFGALRSAMKITWLTFMMGWLAILGVPPFAGFWSKDKIIEAAFAMDTFAGQPAPWAPWVFGGAALFGAGLTAFYMSRLFFMIFHGKARWTTEAEGSGVHPHEAGPLMTIPMIILAVGAVAIGAVLAVGDFYAVWLAPSIGDTHHAHPVLPIPVLMGLTLTLVAAGAGLAWFMYGKKDVPTAVPAGNFVVHAARNDLFQDQVNETVFVTPFTALTKAASEGDAKVVDGAAYGVGALAQGAGKLVAWSQTGNARTYAFYILGGVVFALAVAAGTAL